MKTKKIEEMAKKKNPDRNVEKALKPLFKKKVPSTAKGTVREKDLNITKRKEVEAGLEKTRKELAVIKKTADEASEFAESVIDTVREPLIALDQDLRVVRVSRSFYDFFKVKPEETVGQLIYDLGNKQWDIPKLRELLETILPQKATFDNFEVEHEFPNIGRRVMLLNARQIQRVFGKERIILLAIEDITEHKRLEILLTESEELYKGVFKTASDGIMLLEKGDGKITHTNPAAVKMLGYSTRECIGNKLQDIGFMLDMGDFQTTMQNLNKNGIINYKDVPVKTKYGQHIDMDIYLVNKTKVVQCNIRDITERKRAESQREAALEALRSSEENFRRSLEDSPLGVRIVTAKGETIYANKVLLDIYGYANVEELNKIPLKERYTPQSYAEFYLRKKARDEGDSDPSEYEIAIVRKNKEIRHLQVHRKEVLWNGTRQFQVIYKDISERKQAESQREVALAALRESKERFRIAAENASDLIWEWDIVNGKLEWFGAIDEILGYAPGEFPRTIDAWEKVIHVDDRGRVMAALDQHLKTRIPYREEYRISRKDETIGYWTDKGTAVFNGQGYPYKMIGVCTDITERKLGEDALRESEEKWHSLVNILPDYISLIDREGRFLFLNHYSEGFTEKDVIGSSVYKYLSPESKEIFEKKIVECQNTGKIQGFEYTAMGNHGIMREYENYLVPILEKNKMTNIMAVARDITERKLAEESIRSSLAEKELLLKEVHHRVKNNLMTIIGLIKMQETKADNEMFTTLLRELEGRVRSMALVHESLHKSEDLAHVDLQNYIETMSAHIRAQFGAERNIRFSVQAAGVDVGLDIAIPCGLILNELIANAYKYAFPGDKSRSGAGNCEIAVRVMHEGSVLTLAVADNGVGLPADLDWEKSGTLGLRLIKMLSQQLKGAIELDRSLGTTFHLRFAHSSAAG